MPFSFGGGSSPGGQGPGASVGTKSAIVAAADAPAGIKSQATWICDAVDDQVEIITALQSSYRVITLSEGTFNITAPIGIGFDSPKELIGSGIGNTFLRAQAAMAGVLGDGYAAAMTVRNLTIIGDGFADKGIAYDTDSNSCLIENVHVHHCLTHGVHVMNVSGERRPRLINITSTNNGGIGIVVDFDGSATRWGTFISGCVAEDNGGGGFSVSDECIVSNCRAEYNLGDGLYAFAATNVQIDHCRFDFNQSGIKLDSANRWRITNNVLRGNQLHGIWLTSGTNIHVNDNAVLQSGTLTHNAYANIRLQTTNNCTIIGNTCVRQSSAGTNEPQYGIHIVSGSNNWVANNNCWTSGVTAGIVNAGTSTQLNPGNRVNDGTFSNVAS